MPVTKATQVHSDSIAQVDYHSVTSDLSKHRREHKARCYARVMVKILRPTPQADYTDKFPLNFSEAAELNNLRFFCDSVCDGYRGMDTVQRMQLLYPRE